MKAEKTRHLIDSMLGKILNKDNHLSNMSILNAHLAASDREINQLEKLAMIGSSFMTLLEKEGSVYYDIAIDGCGMKVISTVDELLNFNK